MFAKFKDNQNIVRDLRTKAILNVNETAIKKHEQFIAQKRKEERMQEEINSLKSDITEIKDLLKSMISGNR